MEKKESISKTIKIDGQKIKVELTNNLKPQDIPDEFTGSNRKIKTLIDTVLL